MSCKNEKRILELSLYLGILKVDLKSYGTNNLSSIHQRLLFPKLGALKVGVPPNKNMINKFKFLISLASILLCFSTTHGQNIKQINEDLKLPDSLNQDIEIRVYMDIGITNYSSVLRIFKNNNTWKTEFYEHFRAIKNVADLNTTKKTLTPKNDPEYVYQNLLISYIDKLPTLENIRWKLNTEREVLKVVDTFRGKVSVDYFYRFSKIGFSDGKGFYFQIKTDGVLHSFNYGNPFALKQRFPEIDEIHFVCEILDKLIEEYDLSIYKE